MPTLRPGPQRAAALAPVALGVVAVVLLTGVAGRAALAVDDLVQLLAASGAALACARTAQRARGRRRQGWAAFAVACAGWAAGQAVWSWYELVLGLETPFPSPGDIGFLTFPIGAAVALVLLPSSSSSPGAQRRRLLDGLLVTASLALLSWTTALGAAVDDSSAGGLGTLVALAYPAGDVVVLTMVVLLLSGAVSDRRALTFVGVGTGTIAAADSAFLYLTSLDVYDSDLHLVGLGWATGFLLIGLGAAAASPGTTGPAGRPSRRAGLLPYAPVVLALGIPVLRALTGGTFGRLDTALSVVVVGLVLLRQYALVRDHARLLEALAVREAELQHQAFHDGLTGLVNRALFRDRLANALAQHDGTRRSVTVLFCDLDDFKLVNDTLGHATGDALLVQVARRLQAALRAGDTLSRLGGDEFAVLLADGDDGAAVADALVGALRAPVVVAGREVAVRMSVGATTVPAGAAPPTVDALLAQADTAMYAAKRGGGGAVRSFTTGMALAEVTEADAARALADAVAAREVTLVYQPVVSVASGAVTSVEALARWTHEGRPVPPDEFVALAERTGLIGALTELVLDTACAQAAVWDRPGFRTAVNLSPSSITDPALPGLVARCLQRHGLAGSSLVLEITESGVLQDPVVAAQVCATLRRQGVLLALDDFGVGYASVGHLSSLPLDIVKLDRSLLTGVGTDPERTGFVRAVLRLGTDLGLAVVAEGVEEPEQLVGLREMGMPQAQGSLLCRPQPAALIGPLLDRVLGQPVTV